MTTSPYYNKHPARGGVISPERAKFGASRGAEEEIQNSAS